jgi:hypothetical protein
MTTFLIYLFALFGIVAFVFDLKLTGLLATSAVWTSIWTSLERAGIKRTVLRREILRVEGTETIESREKEAVPDV